MFRKAMFRAGISFCVYIRKTEISRIETLYNCEFVRWLK
jgi:hypothetical protein